MWRKKFLLLMVLAFLLLWGCSAKIEWQNLPQYVNTEIELKKEIEYKMKKVQSFLDQEGLAGILLTQIRNVRWITGGKANTQIVLNKDVGAASLLIMRDGKKYLICNGSEAPRLMNEDLKGLGYELKLYNWYEANAVKDIRGEIIKKIAGDGVIGSDVDFPGTVNKASEFSKLRFQLTESEIKRYRWLGKEVTESVEKVCRMIEPGMSEYEIEYLTAAELRSRGIFPTVLLIGVDDRIFKYRHALPGGAKLKKYAMVNVVAEKWGMPIAVTRFVYFGRVPDELRKKLEACAIVMSKFEEATKPGKSLAEIFEECKDWYAEVGYENEWQKHHQGGAIGYNDREYVIYPGIDEIVYDNQAFAWNPTITGVKVEDTIIAKKGGFEVITYTGNWPMVEVKVNGKVYKQPGILER